LGGTDIVPRSVKASYVLEGIEEFLAKCARGLLKPREYFGKQTNYSVSDWCILTQSSITGWACIRGGMKLKFGDNPLRNKICPGTNKLRLNIIDESSISIELIREPCWERPPKGFYFCRKHFNTYYGQYIRFVFGTAKPNRKTPFFNLPSLLYMVYYGGEAVKVGTTIVLKGFRRFMEQPHLLTSIIYIGNNIEVVRELEIELSRTTPLSQAPRTKTRLSELQEALRREDEELKSRFLCKAMSYLESAGSKTKLPVVKEMVSEIMAKGFYINNIRSEGDELLKNSLMPSSVDEVNRLLGRAACVVNSLSRGLLVMECHGRVISVPYELLRDRIIRVEYLRQ